MTNISDLVAPENAFAMYFQGYLQNRVYGEIDRRIIENLDKRLDLSPYWSTRFLDFQLSVDHLKRADFPVSEKPPSPVHEALIVRP